MTDVINARVDGPLRPGAGRVPFVHHRGGARPAGVRDGHVHPDPPAPVAAFRWRQGARFRPYDRPVTVDDAAARGFRLFLSGDAGSGKTTLLQWLAVRAANGDLPGTHSGERFGASLIPHERCPPARAWRGEPTTAYADARYVVTSRPIAASEDWLSAGDFVSPERQPMSGPDMKEFARAPARGGRRLAGGRGRAGPAAQVGGGAARRAPVPASSAVLASARSARWRTAGTSSGR